MTYQICHWDKHYENNRSRELKRIDWVPVPNRMDGDGYTELLDHKDGAAHLGAWLALVQVASRCDPRGTLMRDTGKPHDIGSISRISRVPVKVLAEALPRFIEIGWLELSGNGSIDMQEGAVIPHGGAGIPQAPDASRVCAGASIPFHSIPFSEWFESTFWSTWPVKENKESARLAARKLHSSERDAVMSGLLAQAEYIRSQERPIHASTWLNQKRWTDEPKQPRQTGSLFPDRNETRRAETIAMTTMLRGLQQ